MDAGAVPLALGITKVVKLLAEWHPSHAAKPNGTWLAGGALSGVVHTPAKVFPEP